MKKQLEFLKYVKILSQFLITYFDKTFYTAIQAVLYVAQLKKGENILIHAGASGVGMSAIQIAKFAGASKIFTTVSSEDKCKFCTDLGADVAINYKTTDFKEVIDKETNGQGVNVIIDLVGRDYWHRNVASAAMECRLVIVAMVSGNIVDDFDIKALTQRRMSIHCTSLRNRTKDYQNALTKFFTDTYLKGFEDGSMKVPIDKIYPWTQVIDAHKRMEANLNKGKIICTTD